MKGTLKAVDSKIIVKVDDSAAVEKIGNITIPADNNNISVAEVISVGSKVKAAGEVNPGDKIYIYKGSGTAFNHDFEKYCVILISDVISVVE